MRVIHITLISFVAPQNELGAFVDLTHEVPADGGNPDHVTGVSQLIDLDKPEDLASPRLVLGMSPGRMSTHETTSQDLGPSATDFEWDASVSDNLLDSFVMQPQIRNPGNSLLTGKCFVTHFCEVTH